VAQYDSPEHDIKLLIREGRPKVGLLFLTFGMLLATIERGPKVIKVVLCKLI
jgi:hypothetical protein